jgi:RNA polymerase sigma factor (sigma-70 family)
MGESKQRPLMTAADRERTPFADLLAGFQAGDEEAIAELFKSYNGVIRAAVRRQLPERLRPEFDSLDFAQDVWASFCAMPADRRAFPSPGALNHFLLRVAHNKVIDSYRQWISEHRHLEENAGRGQSLIARLGPSPSQFAMADEKWEKIAAKLSPLHLAVMKRLREGFSQIEVAEMVGIHARTVTRLIDRVHRLCEEEA